MAIDIDQSHYNTGTATVAANGTAVTGQGTTWLGAVRAGDMWGTHKGSGVRIASVNSNTSITLAYPWLGGAQTADAYEIQRTPYDVGYLAAIEDMIRLYGIGNLPALAGLDGTGGDKGLMLNGAGSAATFALTAVARQLLDDASFGAMRTTMGANDAANLTAGILADARLGPNVLPNAATSDSTTNFNTLITPGWQLSLYRVGAGYCPNSPPNTGVYYHVMVLRYGGNGAQICFPYGALLDVAQPIYWRGFFGSTFFPWQAVGGTLVGTVSQVGGVPTGAVVESGSNANGVYVRLADGTQFCARVFTVSSWAATTAWNGSFLTPNASLTFPAPFVAAPGISPNPGPQGLLHLIANPSTATVTIAGVAPTSRASQDYVSLSYIAQGRWF